MLARLFVLATVMVALAPAAHAQFTGVVVPPMFHDRARVHLDPTGMFAMVTEIGTDDLVSHVTLIRASSLPQGVLEQLTGHESLRMRGVNRLGPAGKLSLGLTTAEVRARFGAPRRVEGPAESRWTYHTDYAPTECVAAEVVILTFETGVLVRIDLAGA